MKFRIFGKSCTEFDYSIAYIPIVLIVQQELKSLFSITYLGRYNQSENGISQFVMNRRIHKNVNLYKMENPSTFSINIYVSKKRISRTILIEINWIFVRLSKELKSGGWYVFETLSILIGHKFI